MFKAGCVMPRPLQMVLTIGHTGYTLAQDERLWVLLRKDHHVCYINTTITQLTIHLTHNFTMTLPLRNYSHQRERKVEHSDWKPTYSQVHLILT